MNEPRDRDLTLDHPTAPEGSPDAAATAESFRTADGPGSILSDLYSTLGPLRSMRLPEADGEAGRIGQPDSDAMPAREEAGTRYQLSGEIARGGMGAVLRGRDVDLGRDLAIKVLLEKYAGRPDVARRFIEEAQIGGQLQHPGVVPVYDIGRFGSRPFFTMKLVKGQTLAVILSERADLAAERPRLLSIALQVAQTLAYAHAKGVIHRDLKPANIMVGAFGEVQVMDWGLAKVLAADGTVEKEPASREHREPEHATMIRTARSSGSFSGSGTDTEAGSILGTPAYMAPEQANGDIANLDRRTDVFGLGAILCEILTGEPPYLGRSAEEIRRKAANGDLADARKRLEACGADAELIDLTTACLAPESVDRPKDAQAVALALTAYLDGVQDRLRKAELAEAEARAKAVEEAKRRRLTLALASTVLLATALGGGCWLWVKSEREARQVALAREVNQAVNKATVLREQAKAATAGGAALFAQAREQAQRALALVETGPADPAMLALVRRLQTELDEEEGDRALIAALDAARLAQAETIIDENRFARERAIPHFREALRAYGIPAGQGEPAAAAARIRERPEPTREALLAALDEWDDLAGNAVYHVNEPHRQWLQAVLDAVEPDDAWRRQVRAARRLSDVVKRRAALEALAATADVRKLPPRALSGLASQLSPAQKTALLRRAQAQYPGDLWLNLDLGGSLDTATPPQHDEAVRFLTAAVALRPESPGCHLCLGLAFHGGGRLNEAIACYRRALDLDPKYSAAHTELGRTFYIGGQIDQAIAILHKAIEVNPKYAWAYGGLGTIFCDQKRDYDAAITNFKKAIELDPNVAAFHHNLGNALRGKGQLDAAIASFNKAIELDPEMALARVNLGVALKRKGQFDAAMACFKKAIELEPQSSLAHENLGIVLKDRGQLDAAIASLRKAVELDPKSGTALGHLGYALRAKGRIDEAMANYKKAIEVAPTLAQTHYNMGNALWAQGQIDQAIASFKKAIELDPKYAESYVNMGALFCDFKRDYETAIALFQRGIALQPELTIAHINLGNALSKKGDFDAAIASYTKAIEIDPRSAEAHTRRGAILCDHKREYDAAIANFKKAIELDPNFTDAHYDMGVALSSKGQVEAAIASFKKAIALDPKQATSHDWIAYLKLDCGDPSGALPFAETAVKLNKKSAQAQLNLARAREGVGDPDGAVAVYNEALRLDPNKGYARAGLAEARRDRDLLLRLPAIAAGKAEPKTPAEGCRFALLLAQHRKRYAAAAGLLQAAFAAEPKLAEDGKAGYRYNAACFAALAAAGQGADSAKLNEKERAQWRKQALDWLRAELVLRSQQQKSGQPDDRAAAQETLRRWQQDANLASLRDDAALAKLSPTERAACTQLWADVAARLDKAQAPATKDAQR